MWCIKVAPRKPSNEGDWVSDNAKTSSVTVEGRIVKIKNVRDEQKSELMSVKLKNNS